MGEGRIFLKKFHVSLFNDDLSNGPNFGLIHLAGHWTVNLKQRSLLSKKEIITNLEVSRILSFVLAADEAEKIFKKLDGL
jgi:hypothetical protein